jgi:hypothetical protein
VAARKGLLIEARIAFHNFQPGECYFGFNVPIDSSLRKMAHQTPQTAVAEQIASGLVLAISEAINILVVGTEVLEPSGPIETSDPPPAMELKVDMYGFKPGQASVQLALPQPQAFTDLISNGRSIRDVMGSAIDIIDQELHTAMRSEVNEGLLLS